MLREDNAWRKWMISMTDAESLPDYIRSIYTAERRAFDFAHGRTGNWTSGPQWDGGEDPAWGRKYNPVWPKITKFVIEWGLDPVEYIRRVFTSWSRANPPQPNQLLSDAARESYVAWCETADLILEQELKTQRNEARGFMNCVAESYGKDWSQYQITEHTLRSTSARLTMLFRYAWAVQDGHCSVADELKSRALEQYVFQRRLYDKVWGDLIPAELKQEASRLTACLG